jgi:hypothetical protein
LSYPLRRLILEYHNERIQLRRFPRAQKQRSRLDVWDILSILTLIMTLCIGLYFVAIFLHAELCDSIPFRPHKPTRDCLLRPRSLQSNWKQPGRPHRSGTETPTLLPTFTLEPSRRRFVDHPNHHPDADKNAQGAILRHRHLHRQHDHPPGTGLVTGRVWAGTIVDANNADMLGITVRLTGFYNSKTKNELTVSGIAPAYGKSGLNSSWERCRSHPMTCLSIQILDQAGLPLSDAITRSTPSTIARKTLRW